MEPIKLVYDKFENETGFIMSDKQGDHTHIKIKDIKDKDITFYTSGRKMHKPKECDIVFDATLFSTKVSVDVKCLSGLDEIIQQSIMNHPNFDLIIEKIVTLIEEKKPTKVGIFCNYGKHRSIGWVSLLKKLYYPKAKCIHEGI